MCEYYQCKEKATHETTEPEPGKYDARMIRKVCEEHALELNKETDPNYPENSHLEFKIIKKEFIRRKITHDWTEPDTGPNAELTKCKKCLILWVDFYQKEQTICIEKTPLVDPLMEALSDIW